MDDNLEDSDVVCAAKLLEIVLQNCRGRVDQVGRRTLTTNGSGARTLVHLQYTGVLAWRLTHLVTHLVEPGLCKLRTSMAFHFSERVNVGC